jgi:hypothetical protein
MVCSVLPLSPLPLHSKRYSMWKNLHAHYGRRQSEWARENCCVVCARYHLWCKEWEKNIKKNGKNSSLHLFCLFPLRNLLKIAYMLITYRLEWIINQDRNYEWNLIFLFLTQCANFLLPFFATPSSAEALYISHHIHLPPSGLKYSSCYSNPCSGVSSVVAKKKLCVCVYMYKWSESSQMMKNKNRGYNDTDERMKRKRATQQGNRSSSQKWHEDKREKKQKSFNIV